MNASEKVYKLLDEMSINYKVLTHPPVFTIEEMEELNLPQLGCIVKNLFLRDSKGKRHFLVMLQQNKKVDLAVLKKKLGSTGLCFASAERLDKYLGLTKGSVSPFGIINDQNRDVEVIVDTDIMNFDYLGVHPNDNTATVWLNYIDIEKIIKNHGNTITLLKL